MREFTCDPKFRKVLITDGKTALGQSLVHAFAKAQADLIWVGHSEPWKKFKGFEELSKIPQVTLLPLDLTDSKNVREMAAEIGVKVDIVVNNAEHHRAFGIATRRRGDRAR
jgi:NAD(P)-dependent dehydrogenase (short-subunit alcohol dehydrogenase family)